VITVLVAECLSEHPILLRLLTRSRRAVHTASEVVTFRASKLGVLLQRDRFTASSGALSESMNLYLLTGPGKVGDQVIRLDDAIRHPRSIPQVLDAF